MAKKDLLMRELDELNKIGEKERNEMIKEIQKTAPLINKKSKTFSSHGHHYYNSKIRKIGYETGNFSKLINIDNDDLRLKYGKKTLNSLTNDELLTYVSKIRELHNHEVLQSVRKYEKSVSEKYDTDKPDKRLLGAVRQLKSYFGDEWKKISKKDRDLMLFKYIDRLNGEYESSNLSSSQVGGEIVDDYLNSQNEYFNDKKDEVAKDIVEDYKKEKELKEVYKNVIDKKKQNKQLKIPKSRKQRK